MAKTGVSLALALVALIAIIFIFMIPNIINGTITMIIRYALIFAVAFGLARA